MRIEEIVGERIRATRDSRGWSQAEFGQMLEPFLGSAWPKQTVSGAERGKRSFTVSDLVALSHVLDVPVGNLLRPPLGVDEIELVSGASVSANVLHEATLPEDAKGEALHDMGQALANALHALDSAREHLGTAAVLHDEVTQ
ncbi:helix-turn-helix domain-containing protein [Rhodococcus opacus]|uniref:helix-turn-helix domain-containing protein n=1 Tax=Rhodococcus opacus TaxID=37919 RepID=UPI002235FEDA|nr:helix-turn-helix transcriptional regulator [Rhodococcus opacus]UZG58006.1 helix-turn-helix domain-containing protein [Rhodococcus opacus]